MPRPPAAVRRARLAVLGLFWLCGLICAFWSASLPGINARLRLGETRIGFVLLAVALGAMAFMPLAGRWCDRWSSRRVVRIVAPAAALALFGPALAPSFPVLLAAAVLLGAGLGGLDVAMNAHAVEVEARYGRPIMSTFHGFWSLGSVGGGLTVTAGLHLEIPGSALMIGGSLTAALLFLLPGPALLPHIPAEPAAGQAVRTGTGPPAPVILLLGAVGMCGMISEGAGFNWAALYTGEALGAGPATASLAYTVFSVALTVTRLTADRVRARTGPVTAMRLAGWIAVAGFALVVAAPWLPAGNLLCGFAGWTVVATGLATVVPAIFSAVGSGGAVVGRALSWVTTMAYAGQLGGPAVIGPLADLTSLGTAMFVPAVLALAVAVAGPYAVRRAGEASGGRIPAGGRAC
ncbi:MFS transporter [Amycolatopsis suaedae]|uniref:MFS transporter n=1 Tax=Amycolatopsis suaedae TaxID=2510978 RepID=UPI0013EF588B|nr:MFS transporter [Amycolatopsis suaedae]